MQIRNAEDYRNAVNEVQRLDGAAEGSAEFNRRHALLAAMAAYEQKNSGPELVRGKPPPRSV